MRGTQIYLRPLDQEDVHQSLRLQTDNRTFFEKYAVSREETFYTLKGQANLIAQKQLDAQKDEGYYFGIFTNTDDVLIGTIQLFHVNRGSLHKATMGYLLDKEHNGKGYTTEAVNLVVQYAFGDLDLHCIEAGAMPHNAGSLRVLEKSGFQQAGLARKNVMIAGKWEEHIMLSIMKPQD